MIKQLVLAVQFLDAKGFVHRDIKPANISVSDDFTTIKLLDFGVLRKVTPEEGSGTDTKKFIATAQYSPPEFLAREESVGATGFDGINLYQVAAVLHDLIMKVSLFGVEAATKNKFILFRAVTENIPRVANPLIAPRLIALCAAGLEKDPAIRLRSVELGDFLADADGVETLRRRLARGSTTQLNLTPPSVAVWAPKVRTWVRAAAQLEHETLGGCTISAVPLSGGQRWRIRFDAADVPIFVDLRPAPAGFTVHVTWTDIDTPAIFAITADGVDLPEAGIPTALAAQYLQGLDEAMVAQPGSSGS